MSTDLEMYNGYRDSECCGNCKDMHNDGCNNNCKHQPKRSVCLSDVCDMWEFGGDWY